MMRIYLLINLGPTNYDLGNNTFLIAAESEDRAREIANDHHSIFEGLIWEDKEKSACVELTGIEEEGVITLRG